MPVRNRVVSFIVSGACLVALAACKQQQAKPAGGPPVVPVTVAKATQESVPTELRVVGSVEASAIVQVKSEIGGELVKVGFTEGQNVAKGDLLFEIDPRPYKAALDQASAVLAVEEPALKVYAFDPGDMRTELHQQAYPGEDISDRPTPESVVPAFLRLLDQGPPSGRYRAKDFQASWNRRTSTKPRRRSPRDPSHDF